MKNFRGGGIIILWGGGVNFFGRASDIFSGGLIII